MRPSTKIKQQRIIEAATQLFLEQGFAHTNLDQVIERCGGSKQTIYSYFGDKRGLLFAVVGHCIESVEQIFNFKYDEDNDLEQQLLHFGINFLNATLSPKLVHVYRIIIAESINDKELAEFFLAQGPHRVSNHLTQYLKSNMDQGRLFPSDPQIACDHLISLLQGSIYKEATLGMPIPSKAIIKCHVEQSVKCFLNGYQTPAE